MRYKIKAFFGKQEIEITKFAVTPFRVFCPIDQLWNNQHGKNKKSKFLSQLLQNQSGTRPYVWGQIIRSV